MAQTRTPSAPIVERRQAILDSTLESAQKRLNLTDVEIKEGAGWLPLAVAGADEIRLVAPSSVGTLKMFATRTLSFGLDKVGRQSVTDWKTHGEIERRYKKLSREVCRYCGAEKTASRMPLCDECAADTVVRREYRRGVRRATVGLTFFGTLAAVVLWFVLGVVGPQVIHDFGQLFVGIFHVLTGTAYQSNLQTPQQAENSRVVTIIIWSCLGVSLLTYLSMWKLAWPWPVKAILSLITPIALIWLIGWFASRFVPRGIR